MPRVNDLPTGGSLSASDEIVVLQGGEVVKAPLSLLPDSAGLTAHIADTTAAHAASAIAFTPAGSISATTVQAAIEEAASEASGIAASIIDAKGDLLVGTAADTVARKAVGADGYILTPSSGATDGLAWTGPGWSLTASVSSDALTVALKGADGNDPSDTNPVFVIFRNVTAGTGTPSIIKITAATSIVVSSGSTGGAANSTAFRFWIVGFNDGGTFRPGFVNCLSGTSILNLKDDAIRSSTAEGGAGAADSAHVIYTGTAVSSKAMRVLGYIEYSSGLATAGTYGSAPTKVQLFGDGVALPGQPVQVQRTQTGAVATGTTAIPNDDTIPQNTEGDQYLSQAITPSAAANLLLIKSELGISHTVANRAIMALFQDSTANALTASSVLNAAGGAMLRTSIGHAMLAGTASATTLKVRAGGSTGSTTTINGESGARVFGGVANSFLEVEEVMA